MDHVTVLTDAGTSESNRMLPAGDLTTTGVIVNELFPNVTYSPFNTSWRSRAKCSYQSMNPALTYPIFLVHAADERKGCVLIFNTPTGKFQRLRQNWSDKEQFKEKAASMKIRLPKGLRSIYTRQNLQSAYQILYTGIASKILQKSQIINLKYNQ